MNTLRPLLLLTVFTAACSSTTAGQSNQPAGNAGAPADARPNIGPYPEGPYGNAVGDVLGNLSLQGYLNEDAAAISNTKPFLDTYSLEDVRATGAKYALVHVSEFF